MRRFRLRAASMLTASLPACAADSAVANPLTPFRHESQAQRHCPADVVVWLDLAEGSINLLLEPATTLWPRLYRELCVSGQARSNGYPVRCWGCGSAGRVPTGSSVLTAVAVSGGEPEAILLRRA